MPRYSALQSFYPLVYQEGGLHLLTLLWKSLKIRKRHWILTIFELVIPVICFTLVAFGRSQVPGLKKVYITKPTYHENLDINYLYSQLDLSQLGLWYTPSNNFTEYIISGVKEKLQIKGPATLAFESREALLNQFNKNNTGLFASIVFHYDNPNELKYDLALYEKEFPWKTDRLYLPPLYENDDKLQSSYIHKGYVSLQLAIDMTFTEMISNETKFNLGLQQFPDPPHIVDSAINKYLSLYIPLLTIFSFIFLSPAVLQRVCEEKCTGTKEFMKIVGLKSSTIWLSWFIHALSTNLFSIIFIIILMKVPFWGVSYPPIEHSDGTLLFMLLFLYCMAAITFCFFIASLISTPSIATTVGVIVWIMSYFIPYVLLNLHDGWSWYSKMIFIISPNTVLQFGYLSVSIFERREIGVQWHNLFEAGSGGFDDITMAHVFVMFLFEIIGFMLITLYIEGIKPGPYGISKPLNFPILLLKKKIRALRFRKLENDESDCEQRLTDRDKPMQIVNLSKKYNNHLAVDNLSLDLGPDSITVLLGENGAGKTTTISIISGMITATCGNIFINGKDLKEDEDEIKKVIGFCPQHNLLFPDLTVQEHLEFFAKIKGSKDLRKDVEDTLVRFKLQDKKHNLVETLSGGMKRKLCLGIAIIANSKVLILDEPTSGMDPESRRDVWDTLKDLRFARVILISTHFMEEADAVADKVAIMSSGILKTYDTPENLKKTYSIGLQLSISLKTNTFADKIQKKIQKIFSKAQLMKKSDFMLIYALPKEHNKSNYQEILTKLENQQKALDIESLSLNETTLNDVFLKVNSVDQVDTSDASLKSISESSDKMHLGSRRHLMIFWALIVKRWYFFKQKYFLTLPAILLTIIILVLAIWLATSSTNCYSSCDGGPCLPLKVSAYGKPTVFYGGTANLEDFYKTAVIKTGGSAQLQENVSNALVESGIANIAHYEKHQIVAAEFQLNSENEVEATAFFSPKALHSVPIAINLVMNAFVKSVDKKYSIEIKHTPLKSKFTEFKPKELIVSDVAISWTLLFPLSMFFLSSIFMLFPNAEITTDFIQIQTMAGVKTSIYWLSNVLFDTVLTFLKLLFIFGLFVLVNAFYSSNMFELWDIFTISCIFGVYILTSLPFIYLLSYQKTVSTSFTLLLNIGFFCGIMPSMALISLEFSSIDENIKNAFEILNVTMMITIPPFGLSYSCLKFSIKYVENINWKYMNFMERDQFCQNTPTPCCYNLNSKQCLNYQNYFTNENVGLSNCLQFMGIGFVLYFLLLLGINSSPIQSLILWFKTIKTEEGNNNISLQVNNLVKKIKNKKIVNKVKFFLKPKECFGLLGVNGAGKTTTMKLLTKRMQEDEGEVTLTTDYGNICIHDRRYCENISYCPQEDNLNFGLTGRELITTMLRIKGYSNRIELLAQTYLQIFGLGDYADKMCAEYSGGNKRKLSTCLAFLGKPKATVLDEPTSGVDPISRQKFWQTLSWYQQNSDTAFLLSSHSMEECEKLCNYVAIMASGKIAVKDPTLYLKHKFIRGFKLRVKISPKNFDQVESIKAKIRGIGGDSEDQHGGLLTFQFKNQRLSQVYEDMENLKNGAFGVIEDYNIEQTSLEDVFLECAKKEESHESIVNGATI